MKRIAHHILRHARAAKHRARQVHYAVWLVLAVVIISGVSTAAFYASEAALVKNQNLSDPVNCRALTFQLHKEQCQSRLYELFVAEAPLARRPICDRERDRSVYGNASILCDAYDIAITDVLYNASVQEYGIAPWEPDVNITPTGVLRVRSVDAIQGIYLVCHNTVIPSSWDAATYRLSYEGNPGGPCVLIATTPPGSITSAAFFFRDAATRG